MSSSVPPESLGPGKEPPDRFGRLLRRVVPLFGMALIAYEASPIGTNNPVIVSTGFGLIVGGPVTDIVRKGGGL
jgi:hypothetical protein